MEDLKRSSAARLGRKPKKDKKREKAKEAAKQQRQAASGSISVHLVLMSCAPSTSPMPLVTVLSRIKVLFLFFSLFSLFRVPAPKGVGGFSFGFGGVLWFPRLFHLRASWAGER